jgi:hypothetical protein
MADFFAHLVNEDKDTLSFLMYHSGVPNPSPPTSHSCHCPLHSIERYLCVAISAILKRSFDLGKFQILVWSRPCAAQVSPPGAAPAPVVNTSPGAAHVSVV